MSEKRKDNKGRLLRTGESQRKNSTYQYRYNDSFGKRQTIYAPTLNELREKEEAVNKSTCDNLNYAAGKITVVELLRRYIGIKQGVRYNTRLKNESALRCVEKYEFGLREIKDVKPSDAQMWMIQLHEDGLSCGTIKILHNVLRPAFQIAVEEDVLRKNPFHFRLYDVVQDDSKKRVALTEEQQKKWLDFIKSDTKNDAFRINYYDEMVVLLGTGLRISEFCGLTNGDLDFFNRRIKVDHQLIKAPDGRLYIEKTKSKNGVRYIPMTQEVFDSLKNLLKNRKCVGGEPIVDGYGGFIMLNQIGYPQNGRNITAWMKGLNLKYKKLHPNDEMPHVTPHVLRHTFCSNMASAGMDVKSLQYIMGHSSVSLTLDVYTHITYSHAEEQMQRAYTARATR